MSPIDDELRAALQGRAQALAPAPDPLSGIERRAKRLQRNRVGAAVAGSVLAVAAVAAVVPALQSTSATPRQEVPRYAAPSTPAPQQQPTSYPLDPRAPWAYRGIPLSELGTGTLDTIEREYAAKRGVPSVELTPLFGQRYEPSQQVELVFLAEVDGTYRWGVSSTPGEAGPDFLWDEALADPAIALAAALPGDEVGRLLVVAAPEATEVAYGPDDASEYTPMSAPAPGVGLIALEGDPATDVYQVTWTRRFQAQPAPDLPKTAQPATAEPATALDPANPWELRGETALLEQRHLDGIAADFANRTGVAAASVEVVPLHVQDGPEDAEVEVVYLVRAGDDPWIWGMSALFEGGWWWYAEKRLEPGTEALVASFPRDGDQLGVLVVSAPSNGGAQIAPPGDPWQPMEDLAPGVFGTVVAGGVDDTRYRVLDGDGDLDRPVTEGLVPPYQNAG